MQVGMHVARQIYRQFANAVSDLVGFGRSIRLDMWLFTLNITKQAINVEEKKSRIRECLETDKRSMSVQTNANLLHWSTTTRPIASHPIRVAKQGMKAKIFIRFK